MQKTTKLVIVGDRPFAEVAYECFTYDSEYEVVAFSVENEYLDKQVLFGLPVVPFEELEQYYAPEHHKIYVAVVYTQLNRLRARLLKESEAKGYAPASYISSRAFVWRNCKIGEHCFIFEDNTVQPFVTIGKNVVLWSGNHIGHHSVIRDNVFISSHVVVSGLCEVGENCFMGVNSCVGDRISVARDCIIGAGAVIVKNTEPGKVYVGNPGKPIEKDSFAAFKVPPETI